MNNKINNTESNSIVISVLNKYHAESIKTIEELQATIALARQEGYANGKAAGLNYRDETNANEINSLKELNKEYIQEIKELKNQLPKAKPIKSTKLKKDKIYIPAYSTSDYIAAMEHDFSFIDNYEIYSQGAKFDLCSINPSNILGSIGGYNANKQLDQMTVGDCLLPNSMEAKKYIYDISNNPLSTQIMEKVFLTYTKKELINFLIETQGGWADIRLLTCDKLIQFEEDWETTTGYCNIYNPKHQDDFDYTNKYIRFPHHLKTANY